MFRVHHRRCGLRTGPFTTGRASSFPVKFSHGFIGLCRDCRLPGYRVACLKSHSGRIMSFSGVDRLG